MTDLGAWGLRAPGFFLAQDGDPSDVKLGGSPPSDMALRARSFVALGYRCAGLSFMSVVGTAVARRRSPDRINSGNRKVKTLRSLNGFLPTICARGSPPFTAPDLDFGTPGRWVLCC